MILAIDTTLGATSACVLAPGETVPVAAETLAMQSGHAEALMPMVDRVVARAPRGFDALTRVGVSIGPGSFTGIRIGVAAARAIGLACRVPVVGISTLAALAAPAITMGLRATVAAAVDARHGRVFIQSFGIGGETLLGPALMSVQAAARALGAGPLYLVGSGAPAVAAEAFAIGVAAEVDDDTIAPDVAFVARLGLLADPATATPRPLYMKAPDAKLPAASSLFAS